MGWSGYGSAVGSWPGSCRCRERYAVQGQSKGLIVGSVLGVVGGLVVGGTLAALFWGDVAAAIRKLTRRLSKRDEQVNFEILLQ